MGRKVSDTTESLNASKVIYVLMSSPRKPAHPDKGNSMSISPFIIFGGIKTLMDHSSLMGFPGGSDGKESACNGETQVPSLGREDPLEKGMATHSSILAWRIPWTEEPGAL